MLGNPDTSNDPLATNVRRCGKCAQPEVRCYHVTLHYNRGIPTGRTYQYRCHACGVEFETLSPWRMITQMLFAFLMVPVGGFMLIGGVANSFDNWWLLLLGLGVIALGFWVGWTAIRSVLNESKNPRS